MNRALMRKVLFIVAIILASAFAIFHTPLHLGLDLRGGVSLILRVKVEDPSAERQREVVEQTREILERRINAYGLAEAPVQPYGSRGNELLVQLPGITDASRIRNLLQSRGVLEWYSVAGGPYASPNDAMAQHGGIVPYNLKLVVTRPAADRSQSWYLLESPPIIRGTDLRDAQAAVDSMEQPVTTFIIEPGGGSPL